MNRDRFYRQIIERLQGKLDPDLFELCAADLLRVVYPTLVPIRGGDDAGMDGAIADGQGEPFPLVTTTAKDVIGNLTHNLKSYLNRGGARRKAVLATSQYLSQRRRENLFVRASELGFTLINIHDQDAMANLLYRSSKWCRELLNLIGDPSPLSAVPRTTRPQLTDALIGRDENLAWLLNTSGDRLLIGQPGSGKTSLLRCLVDDGQALFVISQDRGELAAGIRQQEGDFILIVDDAHLYIDVIKDLIQIRAETGANFSILASCWPSFSARIADALNLSEQDIGELDLVTRDDMVTIVKSAGLKGTDGLIREIVDQAQGRPGLAVTLVFVVLQGGIRGLVSGNVLQRTLLENALEVLALKQRAKLVLATLSLGGDTGMPLNDMAEYLGVSLVDAWEIVTQLDASGIVYETFRKYVSVQPAALRHSLVRDVFFSRAGAPSIDGILIRVPNIAETALTLLGVKARGGRVPEQLLIDLLRSADSINVWREYAWMGQNEANWVFVNYPEKTIFLAQPLLQHIPEAVIPELMNRAVGDDRLLHAHPDHPLRKLSDWIKEARPNTGQAIYRRQVLLRSVKTWLQAENDTDVGLKALELTIFPGVEFSSTDPGSGNTVTLSSGLLSFDELSEIGSLWGVILKIIEGVEIERWKPIQRLVENWAFPGRVTLSRVRIPEEVYQQMQSQAVQMLNDVVNLALHRQGVMHWAIQIADRLNIEIDIPLDEDFQILYPQKEYEDWKATEKHQAAAMRELANQWCKEDPRTIVKRIANIENEAQNADLRHPRWTPYLCLEIAQKTESAAPWLQAFLEFDLSSELIAPFLDKAAQSEEPKWEDYAHAILDRSNYKIAAIILVLRLQNPPWNLFERVLEELSHVTKDVDFFYISYQMPDTTLKNLLRHENAIVAVAAAKGEWFAEPRGRVRESVAEEWQSVFLNQVKDDYWLREVFQLYPGFAYKWLEKQLSDPGFLVFKQEESVKAAINVLDSKARKQIVDIIPVNRFSIELVAYLIGEDLEIYNHLLSSKKLEDLHLAPLIGFPEGSWIEKALLAFDAGYTPQTIAGAILSAPKEWSGNESDMWATWIDKFEALLKYEDERIQAIGAIGRDWAKVRQDEALRQEKLEAVFGRW